MLELTMNKWGYLEIDTDEWIDDRTDGTNEAAQRAMDHALDNGLQVEEWLEKIGATGLYGDPNVSPVLTHNCDNYLSTDLLIWHADTEKFGELFIWQYADVYGGHGRVEAYTFIGDDDADAWGFSGGYAYCDCQTEWKGGGCDAEWIIESACKLWQNGGGQTENISDVIHHDDDLDITYAVCPRCGYGNLTFYAE